MDTLFDKLDYAREVGDGSLSELCVYAIEKELDKEGGDGKNDKLLNTLVKGLIENKGGGGNKDIDAINMLDKVTDIQQKLTPKASQTSENVEMTKAIGGIVKEGITEVRETVNDIWGSGSEKEKAQQVLDHIAACPVCKNPIFKDNEFCGYCGARFSALPQEGVYPDQQQQQQAQPRKRVSGKQQEHDSMKSSYGQQQQQQAQQPQQPPPQQPQQGPPQQPPTQPIPEPQPPPNLDPADIKKAKKYAKRLANAIAKGKNPVKMLKLGWGLAGKADREKMLVASIIGRERWFWVIDHFIPHFPDMHQELATIKSQQGVDFLDVAIDEIKNCARKANLSIKKSRFEEIRSELETKIGFHIPDDI